MYLRQRWRDPRLAYEHLDDRRASMHLPDGSWDRIWIPDTFFPNEKGADFHTVTINNRYIRLHLDGSILYSTRWAKYSFSLKSLYWNIKQVFIIIYCRFINLGVVDNPDR